ncbi:MAG: hypothetical protein ACON5F_09805 [Jejuia sp.]
MKLRFKLTVIVLVIFLFNCGNVAKEKTLEEFKFTGKGIVVSCNDFNVKLLNEALFSFEEDILEFYGKTPNAPSNTPNLSRAYSQFIRSAIYGQVKYAEVLSPHSIKVFEVLKSKSDLWEPSNPTNKLNYNNPLIGCIANNILDKDLKTTFSALLETDSMSPKLFGPALQSNYGAAMRDKYLSTYVALEFYYGKLFNVDLSKVSEKKEEPVDFNKIPKE